VAGNIGRLVQSIREQTRKEGTDFYVRRAAPFAMRYFFSPFLSYYYANRFKATVANSGSVDDAVETAFSFGSLGFPLRIDQVREEVTGLLNFLKTREPRLALEIGTAGGGTLFLLARVSHPSAKIMSIDLPGGLYGLGYPAWKIPLLKAFAKGNQEIRLIRADSHSQNTYDRVKSELADEKLDFLFIDGDHTYEGVKRDFDMYSSLVKKDGFIALHDVVRYHLEDYVDVSRFWRELRERYEHWEFVKSWDQGWAGIGVVKL